jgi:lysophospholipase L1-like esterase
VTYVPLGCTGATIAEGLLGPKAPREIYCFGPRATRCVNTVPPQVALLEGYARRIPRAVGAPAFDAIMLTIGANDIGFSGLVASVTLDPILEEKLQEWGILFESAETAEAKMRNLRPNFRTLSRRLLPLVGGQLKRVVFTTYANPGTSAPNTPCPKGRVGFDVHPLMYTDDATLKRAWDFTENKFLPELQKITACPLGTSCENNFTFVHKHRELFVGRGYCSTSITVDPTFDRQCFKQNGDAFYAGNESPIGLFRCNIRADQYRAYVSRQRWMRSPNDSYFAANTFPDAKTAGARLNEPFNLLWAANYGGAFHPTAEGHAAIADTIVPALKGVLGLD